MISSKTFSVYGRVATRRRRQIGDGDIRRETHGESFVVVVVVVVTLSLIHFLFNRYN